MFDWHLLFTLSSLLIPLNECNLCRMVSCMMVLAHLHNLGKLAAEPHWSRVWCSINTQHSWDGHFWHWNWLTLGWWKIDLILATLHWLLCILDDVPLNVIHHRTCHITLPKIIRQCLLPSAIDMNTLRLASVPLPRNIPMSNRGTYPPSSDTVPPACLFQSAMSISILPSSDYSPYAQLLSLQSCLWWQITGLAARWLF